MDICELAIGDLGLRLHEDPAPLPAVGHRTGVRDVHLTPLVHVHLAGVTFHPLTHHPIQHRATVITEGGPQVSAGFERVLAPGTSARLLLRASTGSSNRLMAPLVNRKMAPLAPVALFAHPPEEAAALAAEGGLPEDVGSEFVPFHLVHLLLPQRSFAGQGTVGHGPSRTLLASVGEQEGRTRWAQAAGGGLGEESRRGTGRGGAADPGRVGPEGHGAEREGWAAYRLAGRPGAQ